jgi:peroxiredoxin
VGWLRDTDVASHALKVGDTAPDFLLPDADRRLHSSEQQRRNAPLAATLAVVTPETRDFPRKLKLSLGLDLKGLSDIDCGVGVSYGVLFRVPDEDQSALFRAHAVIMAHGCHLQAHVGMARSYWFGRADTLQSL